MASFDYPAGSSLRQGNWQPLRLAFSGIQPVTARAGDVKISEIYLDEEMGEQSFHINGTSSARMVMVADAIILQEDPSLYEEVCKTLMGGWWLNKKVPPAIFPRSRPVSNGQAAMYCTDVAARLVAPYPGGQVSSPGGVYGQYQKYQRLVLQLEFRSLPYTVKTGKNDWIQFGRSATNQRIGAAQGYYEFTKGDDKGKPASSTVWYSAGITYINLKFHQTPHTVLFAGQANAIQSIADPYVGTVNSSLMIDAGISTMLLDSVSLDDVWGDYSTSASDDPRRYAPVLHYLFNPQGWQNCRDSTGTWTPIGIVNGGDAPPFIYKDHNVLCSKLEASWNG